MTRKAVCYLSYPHPRDIDEPTVRRAQSFGYEALFLTSYSTEPHFLDDLRQACDLCRKFGMQIVVSVDVRRFSADNTSVLARPQDFMIHRGSGQGAIDPRKSKPPSGDAFARLNDHDTARRLREPIFLRLAEVVQAGVGGVCLARADRLPAALVEAISTQVIEQGVSVGGQVASVRAIAGLDYLIVDHQPDQFSASPALSIPIFYTLKQQADQPGKLRAMFDLAVLLGGGAVVPGELAGVLEALETDRSVTTAGTGVHPIACTSLDMFMALRVASADPRTASRALLIVANLADRTQDFPRAPAVSQHAAAFLSSDLQPALAPYEVRTIEATRKPPILRSTDNTGQSSPVGHRLVIGQVLPTVDDGAFPIKCVIGDTVRVEATIYADGHEQLAAEVHWRAADVTDWNAVRMEPLGNDRWAAQFALERLGWHEFLVEGWLDRFGGFQRDFAKKVAADVALPIDHAEGRTLVEEAAGRCRGQLATELAEHAKALHQKDGEASITLLLSDELGKAMDQADDRPHTTRTRPFPVDAERIEARFSSWYELFPRSMGPVPAPGEKPRHGTFADVIDHLPRVRDMGFDTLYFPPIHPIGTKNRKGPNNTLTPGPDDPGSPYAIGSAEGGHDAIHPELGTFADFDQLVAAASDHGLEIALDFAIQAAPDHPWLKEHPGWFAWRPDGSMKYAENPPKKYQDIVNVDFYGPDAVPGLWEALRDVILLWVEHGVKTFRVDNPHTKPLPFWEWMIGEVRGRHPEVIFLSEAFTRPTMMYRLAKVGFSQSYTYFTWRDDKQGLTDYITELTTEAPRDFYRPHFFVNTPDINPGFLQTGGRPAHRIRAVLAATLSGLWGVYSGFELCDATPLGPDKEEYLNSEKYEMRPREWRTKGDIADDVTLLNRLRRSHVALQTHLNTRFYVAHDENIIWYGKPTPAPDGTLSEMLMVMVNMDPHNAHGCDFEVPLWEFGLDDNAAVAVEDLAAGYKFSWNGKVQHIDLTPDEPYRIWRLTPGGAA